MVLKKVFRNSTGRFEYALVSKTNPNKILFWFGKKPSKSEFLKQERRIQFFKNMKGRKSFAIVRPHKRKNYYGSFKVKKHVRRYK